MEDDTLNECPLFLFYLPTLNDCAKFEWSSQRKIWKLDKSKLKSVLSLLFLILFYSIPWLDSFKHLSVERSSALKVCFNSHNHTQLQALDVCVFFSWLLSLHVVSYETLAYLEEREKIHIRENSGIETLKYYKTRTGKCFHFYGTHSFLPRLFFHCCCFRLL